MRNRLLLAALLLLAGVMLAAAQSPSPQIRAAAMACRADIETLCAGIERGGGRIAACLRANAAKVSPGCRDALRSAQEARRN